MNALPSQQTDDVREQLSAWHDGALAPEPARFLQRRLDADDTLRESVGRWQLIGDVMRGVPCAEVTPGLSHAVFARLDAESAQAQREQGHRGSRRVRWWGAGLAAGLGALFLLPFVTTPGGEAPAAIAVPPVALVARASLPVQAPARPAASPSPLALPPTEVLFASSVPPLVRAPQPSAAQLAPLPSVDAPSRPWPRSHAGEEGYTVGYRVDHGASGTTRR